MRLLERIFDLAIIGGGVNGCGIARDAVGRGNTVFLCEMNDLASGTSSWSTKLVHGGLRYLEYYEFRLVREALIEREILWGIAPHIIRPLRFVLPHHAGLRPAWLLRLGLFLYDHIGGRHLLPATRSVDLGRDEVGRPLIPNRYSRAFEYSDCFVDDARLVVLNARDAADKGAEIRTRTRATEIRQADGVWTVSMVNTLTGARSQVQARALVNAGGPWVEDVLGRGAGVNAKAKVRLVQGSHIVVKKLYDHDRAYMFQNADGRIIFVIPYQDDFTLIGTTDRDYDGDPAKVKATPEEFQYLCAAASEYLAKPVTSEDVVWTYSGVRPLYDDGASEAKAATRDYVFELDTPGGSPLLSIYGGKITTYPPPRRGGAGAAFALSSQRESARGLDRQMAAARRRHGCVRHRRADRRAPARLSLPRPCACAPPRARLWHPCHQAAWRCEIGRRPRPGLRRDAHRARGPLSHGQRMGRYRRGHRLAPFQARPATICRRDRGA
ncbi:glycerol-3-phosphate dehydrogenase [Bradyrhizobium japonicum]